MIRVADLEETPMTDHTEAIHDASPDGRLAKRAAWQKIKARVHDYARHPSRATASEVASAFQALRDQDDAGQVPSDKNA
jgi:hypothetical protein